VLQTNYYVQAKKYKKFTGEKTQRTGNSYLLRYNIGHSNILTIAVLINVLHHGFGYNLVVLWQKIPVQYGRLSEHNCIHTTPPRVLPVQIPRFATENVECMHARGKANQSAEQVEERKSNQ
jgi:hypothetical protein